MSHEHESVLLLPEAAEQIISEISLELVENDDILFSILTNKVDLHSIHTDICNRVEQANLLVVVDEEPCVQLCEPTQSGLSAVKGQYAKISEIAKKLVAVVSEELIDTLEPERVVVLDGEDPNKIVGEATYIGEKPCKDVLEPTEAVAELLGGLYGASGDDVTSPAFKLDNGDVVLGLQIYWRPLSVRIPFFHPAHTKVDT